MILSDFCYCNFLLKSYNPRVFDKSSLCICHLHTLSKDSRTRDDPETLSEHVQNLERHSHRTETYSAVSYCSLPIAFSTKRSDPITSRDTTQLASVRKANKNLQRFRYHGIVSWPFAYHPPASYKSGFISARDMGTLI